MKEDVFKSKWSFKAVTKEPASCTVAVHDKFVKLIDTPGFLDPSSLTKLEEFVGLAKAIIDMPNGIHAVGIVINIQNRITSENAKFLRLFLAMKEMISHTFIIFTHAKALGDTDDEQQLLIDETLKSTEECPEILKDVLGSINDRYMLLESVEAMEQKYYEKKSHQLLQILEKIMTLNKTTFSCALNTIANQLEILNDQDEDELVEALTKDLQTVSIELKRQEKNEAELFWKNLVFYIAGGIGIGVGAGAIGAGIVFSSAIAAATSSVFKFLSRNPQLVEPFTKAMADALRNYFRS